MSETYLSQPTCSVMSIGAITSPCSENKENINSKSEHSLVDDSYNTNENNQTHQINELKTTIWCETTDIMNDDILNTEMYENMAIINKRRASSNNIQEKTSLNFSTTEIPITVSPSISSSSNSDHESDTNHSYFSSQKNSNGAWMQPYIMNEHKRSRIETGNSMFTDHLEDQLNDIELFFDTNKLQKSEKSSRSNSFSFEDINYIYSDYQYNKKDSLNKKNDALTVRRARNRLASAKYRAKKQALSHAMQDRIMQLATQVITLRNELLQTKKSECEIKLKYERLLQYYKSNNSIINSNNQMGENAATNSLF